MQRHPHLFRSGVTVPGVDRARVDDDLRYREACRRRILREQQLVRCEAGLVEHRDLIASDDFHGTVTV